jgi:hypothetical protein
MTSLRWLVVVSLIVIGTSFGCATPGPIVRLYPNAGAVLWVAGRASVVREEGGIRVATAFEQQDGGAIGIRVEVENGTEANLDLDPREFTFTVCRNSGLDTCGLTQRVIDPEAVLASLDVRQSRERASASNSQGLLGALVLLSAVGDVATVGSRHADHGAATNTVATASLMESDKAAHDSSLASIGEQKAMWSNEALRRNTVLPGSGAAGLVFMPTALDAGIVWLHVRTGGHTFSFPFRQVVTRIPVGPAGQPVQRF